MNTNQKGGRNLKANQLPLIRHAAASTEDRGPVADLAVVILLITVNNIRVRIHM